MKKHLHQFVVLSTLFLFLLTACGGSSKSEDDIPFDDQGREDFGVFLEKFYSNIDFQLKRIDFPVEGKMKDDGLPEFIEEDEWTVLRKVDESNPDYEVYNILNGDIATQKVIIKRSALIELGFNLYDNHWYLTRYSGISASNIKSSKSQPASDTTATMNIQQDSTTMLNQE